MLTYERPLSLDLEQAIYGQFPEYDAQFTGEDLWATAISSLDSGANQISSTSAWNKKILVKSKATFVFMADQRSRILVFLRV